MATQATAMNPERPQPGWSSLTGRVLEGGFELQEIIEADERQARLKVRVLGDRDLDCVALFYECGGAAAESQADIWTTVRLLRHPNLSAPLGAGQLIVDGTDTVYAVVRRADESLDGVLGERALTADEAREVLENVSKGLEALHLNGYVHGCLAPSRVLAVGETIKLPAECVRAAGTAPAVRVFAPAYLAPESTRENVTPGADLWCLGAMLFEALTQKPWTEESREETGDLPEPFASIALRCLHIEAEGRASLGEVVSLLRGELRPVPRVRAAVAGLSTAVIVPQVDPAPEAKTAVPEPAAPIPSAPTRLATPDAAPVAASAAKAPIEPVAPEIAPAAIVADATPVAAPAVPIRPSISMPAPERTTEPRPHLVTGSSAERRAERAEETEEHEHGASKLWLWAAITLVAVLGLIWFLRPTSRTPASGASPATAAATPTPAPVGKNKGTEAYQTRVLEPDGSASAAAKTTPEIAKRSPKPAAAAATPPPAAAASAGAGPAVWRVISYTYAHRQDAERKAAAINAKHGNLHAEVFTPSGSGPYLLALGGRMTREDAAQLRRKAVNAGMPRDTYVQNFRVTRWYFSVPGEKFGCCII